MKIQQVISRVGVIGLIFSSALHGGMQLYDSIEAVVYSPSGPRVITKWDVARPPLGGAPQTVDEIILEMLITDDAQKLKVSPSEADVDRILDMVRQQNGMTMPQLKEVVEASGYTMEEIRDRFRRMQIVSQMLDYRVRSNVIVPRRKVVEYHEANPEVIEGQYVVRRAQISLDPVKSMERQATDIKAEIEAGDTDQFNWEKPFTLAEVDISAQKRFLLKLKEDEVSEPRLSSGGFEVYQMIARRDKKTPTLDERFAEITEKLKQPIFEKVFEEYKKKLFDEASVLRFS